MALVGRRGPRHRIALGVEGVADGDFTRRRQLVRLEERIVSYGCIRVDHGTTAHEHTRFTGCVDRLLGRLRDFGLRTAREARPEAGRLAVTPKGHGDDGDEQEHKGDDAVLFDLLHGLDS